MGTNKERYVITITERYAVMATSPDQALGSYRVAFDNVPAYFVNLAKADVLDQDAFEYLDGKGEAVVSEVI